VLPSRLSLVPGSVVNGTAYGNAVAFQGTLAAATPGTIDVRPGPTNDGYLSLSNYYAPFPCMGSCDDRTFAGPVPEGILYNGTVYTSIEMSTNGFMRLGGGGGGAAPVNLQLPSPMAPSNTLAPFWTDLHPAGTDGQGSGTLYAGKVAYASGREWLVLEWKDVVEKNGTAKYSFEVWLRLGGTVEDVTFTYNKLEGNGAGGFVTIGAQNGDGTTGESYYYNGSGGFPVTGIDGDLIAASPGPSPGGARTITFQARGIAAGAWTNCGVLVNNLDSSASVSCFNGTVK
jgi:minor extracellular serine protease Vpr